MDSAFVCLNPKCSQRLSVAGLAVGQGGRCPRCGSHFVVPPVAGQATPAAEVAAPAPAPASSLPVTIGPYQVRAKLGQGAFGVVYRAHDPAMERDVAIKMLNATSVKSKKYLDRFLREARVVGQMLHGNIVPVYQLGQLGADYYIVSAFIPGRPLDAAIPEDGLDPVRAVTLVIQLLEALEYAHQRGVLHRDVKPANAMLDDHGTLYLMDFGLAGLLDQEGSRMTQDGTVMGTPAYMPPEQAKGNIQQMGPSADQYSAGMVLYELLTGRLAFEAPSLAALLYLVLEAPPLRPTELRPDLDPALEVICLKALAKVPANRFSNCREFADALKAWLGSADPSPRQTTTAILRSRAAATAGTAGPRSTLNTPTARQTAGQPSSGQSRAPAIAPPVRGAAWRPWLALGLGALTLLVVIGYLLLAGKGSTAKPADVSKKGVRGEINQ